MKISALAAIAWLLTAVVTPGQDSVRGIRSGSAEAIELEQKQKRLMEEYRRQAEKDDQTGLKLFGRDTRLEKPEYCGTLSGKTPPNYKIGDWGAPGHSFRVLNVVNKTEVLLVPVYRGAEPMLLRGLDTSKVTDGAQFTLHHPVVIRETYRYTSAAGTKKTVFVLECNNPKLESLAAEQRVVLAELQEKAAQAQRLEAAQIAEAIKKLASGAGTRRNGAAAYDDFPESLRSQLLKDWGRELNAAKESIRNREQRIRENKASLDRKPSAVGSVFGERMPTAAERQQTRQLLVDDEKALAKAKESLATLEKNDPPFFTKARSQGLGLPQEIKTPNSPPEQSAAERQAAERKAAEEKAARNEKDATTLLGFARKFFDADGRLRDAKDSDQVRKSLESLVKSYPDTKAGGEAKKLLEKLGRSESRP